VILRQFHLLAYTCGIVILLCLVIMKLVGPPPPAFPLRTAIVAAMLVLAGYSGVPVTREVREIQPRVSGPMKALSETGPRRARFDHLHSLSTTLMTINMALGLVLLFWYVQE